MLLKKIGHTEAILFTYAMSHIRYACSHESTHTYTCVCSLLDWLSLVHEDWGFAVFVCHLVHSWYLSKFEDYPKHRKAFIPFIL